MYNFIVQHLNNSLIKQKNGNIILKYIKYIFSFFQYSYKAFLDKFLY